MLIKSADSKDWLVSGLESLLARDDCKASHDRIKLELLKLKAGIAGENAAAYELNRVFNTSKNWAILHDFRFEVDGYVYQIDHLLLNRLREVVVLESKSFAEGVSINAHGEFCGYYKGHSYGMPSPLEQNRRHCEAISKLLATTKFGKPTNVSSYVLISASAKISRPKYSKLDLSTIVKVDQFFSKFDKDIDDGVKKASLFKSVLTIAGMVGSDTLRSIADRLAILHMPAVPDYKGKFGLSDIDKRTPLLTVNSGSSRVSDSSALGSEDVVITSEHPSVTPTESTKSMDYGKKTSQFYCAKCRAPISENIAKYCFNNPARFGGKAFCMKHQ